MAAPLGILIHLALSLVMGCVYVLLIWQPFARRAGMAATLLSAALALAAVWATNFFVILPALNPTFVALMPYAVTFTSKMLFALALTGVLIAGNSRSRKQASSNDRTSERSEQGFLFGLRPSPRSHRRSPVGHTLRQTARA
jgi:H+/gluconate symporter-like permease